MEQRSKEKVVPYEIYTDGSLKKIGKFLTFGGWAFFVLQDNKLIYYASGNECKTTNQRMELVAVIESIKYIQTIRKPNEKVIIYCDSAYIINCYLKEWYLKWQTNGWINSQGNDVANKDLWLQLIPYFYNFWYEFRKVAGHSDVYWNEKCDELAQKEAKKIKDNWRG